VFILEKLKVLCFDTLLQVLILKVDSGIAGALARFLAVAILLPTIFLGNVGGKGVSGLAEYFMGYYTIWLALVKTNFCPVLGLRDGKMLVPFGAMGVTRIAKGKLIGRRRPSHANAEPGRLANPQSGSVVVKWFQLGDDFLGVRGRNL
jgi:hypothetical protein